jgi:hypothetical protein
MFLKKRRPAPKPSQGLRRKYCRLGIESLENRRLLTSIVVTTASDVAPHTGESLRDAIVAANADAKAGNSDTITFAPNLNGQTILLTQGDLELGQGGNGLGTITIDGGNQVTVSGNDRSGVFVVDAHVQAKLAGLTITGGDVATASTKGGGIENFGNLRVFDSTILGNSAGAGVGGGIYNDGTLTVNYSTISTNSAFQGGGIDNDSGGTLTVSYATISGNSAESYEVGGGGIYNNGVMTVSRSTISGNTAQNGRGAFGGGIQNAGTLTVSNSTISANIAFFGGGIENVGTLTVTSSTISGNAGYAGGGIGSSYATLTLLSTIVAGNNTATDPDLDQIGGTLSGSYNLIGNGTGQTGLIRGTNGNQIGTAASPIDPLLGPLANNGGKTQTMALLAGSPALNAGGALTTLDSSITSCATSITVGLASAIASTPGRYVIQIGSEQMLVTNVDLANNSLTVERGYNGTTATGHSSGAGLILPFDQIGQPRVGSPDIGAFEDQKPPALAIGGPAVTYYPLSAPIAIAPSATLTTGDGAFANASLSVVDSTFYTNDRLGIGSSGGLVVSGTSLIYDGIAIGSFTGGGTQPLAVTFNASATQAAVLAIVRNVTYTNVAATPTAANRTITFQLTDGLGFIGAAVKQTVAVE